MGKIDSTTILLIAGAVAIYFVMRPTTPAQYPPGYNPYAAGGSYNPYSQPSQLPGLIQAGGSAASNLITSLFGTAPLGTRPGTSGSASSYV